MDIKGLDYNTQREKLIMPCELPTKEERLQCARAIIRQMETKNPQLKENADFEQTLWDHLYLMSHRELEIDWPYDVSEADKILSKPDPIKPPKEQIRLRHYGKLICQLFEKLKTMPAGEERDALTYYTANQMKRDLMTWGHGSMDDEKVADDLATIRRTRRKNNQEWHHSSSRADICLKAPSPRRAQRTRHCR